MTMPKVWRASKLTYRRAVSLFSNCGAGDIGYARAGFRFDVMAELIPWRLKVATTNHPGAVGIEGDLRQTWKKVIAEYRKKSPVHRPALLAACPPCQGMSSARSGRGKEDDPSANDERNYLVTVIAGIALELKPALVVVENVPAFLRRKILDPETRQPISAASYLSRELSQEYDTFAISTDLCDYGIPQSRKRVFLTSIRKDVAGLRQLRRTKRAPFPRPTHGPEAFDNPHRTIAQALMEGGFTSLDAKSTSLADGTGVSPLHFVPAWNKWQYEMVKAIPRGSGRSAWSNTKCGDCRKSFKDLGEDDSSCPACGGRLLRPTVVEKDGSFRLIKGFRTSSYRRMSPDLPAATITTASGHVGSDLTIHPTENRLLSPAECSYLQTIPREFDWGDTLSTVGVTGLREMIGEAVPPEFTRLHGLVLKNILTNTWNRALISAYDDRCTKAMSKLAEGVDAHPALC